LSRFDVSFDSAVPTAVRNAAQEHDSHALADLVQSVMGASDPKDKLARLRTEAQELAGELGMPVPRWLGSWD
jgi:hypothetical protein